MSKCFIRSQNFTNGNGHTQTSVTMRRPLAFRLYVSQYAPTHMSRNEKLIFLIKIIMSLKIYRRAAFFGVVLAGTAGLDGEDGELSRRARR